MTGVTAPIVCIPIGFTDACVVEFELEGVNPSPQAGPLSFTLSNVDLVFNPASSRFKTKKLLSESVSITAVGYVYTFESNMHFLLVLCHRSTLSVGDE